MEKIIQAPLINLLAIFAEAQLFRNWVPMCRRSEIIKSHSHFRKAADFEFYLPWPLANRAFRMQANGIALPDENGAILTMSSIDQDSWLGEALDARPNNLVFADLNRGAFMI